MVRIWIVGIALALALAMPATAQQRPVPQILERLHALCDQDYKPACIKLGFVIGRLQPGVARKLRRDHPEWWWWNGGSANESESLFGYLHPETQIGNGSCLPYRALKRDRRSA
jgi:hypothetical protein